MSTLYAIEYYVGVRRGGWLMGETRYGDPDRAFDAATAQAADERKVDIIPFLRRVVSA